MLRIRVGENGKLDIKINEIKMTRRGTLEVQYENINEPANISQFKVTLSFDGSMWQITDYLVYRPESGIHEDVKGLFSPVLSDALRDKLVSYYIKQEHRYIFRKTGN